MSLFDQIVLALIILLLLILGFYGLYRLLKIGIAYEKQVSDNALRGQRLPPDYERQSDVDVDEDTDDNRN